MCVCVSVENVDHNHLATCQRKYCVFCASRNNILIKHRSVSTAWHIDISVTLRQNILNGETCCHRYNSSARNSAIIFLFRTKLDWTGCRRMCRIQYWVRFGCVMFCVCSISSLQRTSDTAQVVG